MVGITDKMMNDTRTDTLPSLEAVKEGDIVYVVIDKKRRYIVRVESGRILGTDKGFIRHKDLIGRPYGSCIKTSLGHKAYILKPLHYDVLHGYKRVTQVIYPKDSSFIVYLAGIGPGSRVVEAGVGTGFLSTYIAHVIGSTGKLYVYEIRDDVIDVAEKNLRLAGLVDRIVFKHMDIRNGIEERDVDAVILDIPDPWNVVEHAYNSLKPCHPFIAYVPTINQVEKIVRKLKEHKGFIDIRAFETLYRDYIVEEGAVRPNTFMVGHTGYIVYARKILF